MHIFTMYVRKKSLVLKIFLYTIFLMSQILLYHREIIQDPSCTLGPITKKQVEGVADMTEEQAYNAMRIQQREHGAVRLEATLRDQIGNFCTSVHTKIDALLKPFNEIGFFVPGDKDTPDSYECVHHRLRDAVFYMRHEGITNAWKHGNQCDPAQPILAEFSVISEKGQPKTMECITRVGDTGPGFDMQKDVPRSIEESMKRWDTGLEGGLGVVMMEGFAKETKYYKENVQLRDADPTTVAMHIYQMTVQLFKA